MTRKAKKKALKKRKYQKKYKNHVIIKNEIEGGNDMKMWAKIHLKEQNKNVEQISKSLTNYLYGQGPILDIAKKYNLSQQDYQTLNQYMTNRISGLLLLYLTNDIPRINDIVNKYNIETNSVTEILPEIEGYMDK